MRFSLAVAGAVLPTLLLFGCSDEPPAPAAEQPFASICTPANKGQRVAVRGYLRLPDSNSGDFSIVLRLFETPAFTGPPIGATMRFGTEPHHLDVVPTSYTDNDLRVHLADGTIAGYGVPVRVSGTMYEPLVGQDFACALENLYVEAAP